MSRLPIAGRCRGRHRRGERDRPRVACSLAARGCHLAIADVDETGLAETASMAAAAGVTVTRHRLDVTDAAAITALPDAVRRRMAGPTSSSTMPASRSAAPSNSVSDADFEWVVNVNFWGVVRMTRAFLPLLHASDDARLVNLSSLFGLVAPRGRPRTAPASSRCGAFRSRCARSWRALPSG